MVIEKAQAIDRRRQAQIENQKASINRLLVNGEYTAEMQTLFQAAASLQVENEMLGAAMKALVASIDALPLDGLRLGRGAHVTAFAEALAAGRALITPAQPGTDGVDPLRSAVSASGPAAG